MLGQVEVGAKAHGIPMFAQLLEGLAATGLDLAHAVITADALNTQRTHAEYLHSRGAEFVFTVQHNQPGLFIALDALHLHNRRAITEATRWASRSMDRPFKILKLVT